MEAVRHDVESWVPDDHRTMICHPQRQVTPSRLTCLQKEQIVNFMSDSLPVSPRGSVADAATVPTNLAALRWRIAALEHRPVALEDATDGNQAARSWPLGIDILDD